MALLGGRGLKQRVIVGFVVAVICAPVLAQNPDGREIDPLARNNYGGFAVPLLTPEQHRERIRGLVQQYRSQSPGSRSAREFRSAIVDKIYNRNRNVTAEVRRLTASFVERERILTARIEETPQSAGSLERQRRQVRQQFQSAVSTTMAAAGSLSVLETIGVDPSAAGRYYLHLKDSEGGTTLAAGEFSVDDYGGRQFLGEGSGVQFLPGSLPEGCGEPSLMFPISSVAITVDEHFDGEKDEIEGVSRVKSLDAAAREPMDGIPVYILNLFPGSGSPGVGDPSGGSWTMTVIPTDVTCNGGSPLVVGGYYDFNNQVPEPPLPLLFGTGLASLYFLRRRYRFRLRS